MFTYLQHISSLNNLALPSFAFIQRLLPRIVLQHSSMQNVFTKRIFKVKSQMKCKRGKFPRLERKES